MKLYLIILNYIIFDFSKCDQREKISHNEVVEGIGVSEQALKKLQELKKIELDLLIDIADKDIHHNDIYSKYHCISSDFISFSKNYEMNSENNNNEQNRESESISKVQSEKSTSFFNKVSSFLGIFDYNNKNKIPSNKIDVEKYKKKEKRNDNIYKEENNVIIQKKSNSYMQLNGFNLAGVVPLFGSKDSPKENVQIGNFGSFFFIFGKSNTDYPWACACDPRQLKEYKEKKRNFVLCNNEIDMSIQNSDLICNFNNSFNFYLSYILIFLIILIYI
ncbi:conserved Plasmodium protein, unknown function [Plasmodium relictum]|uniref:Uncharacterized protein n=1 Tax=Plasmodium relictum TaxID=85471 RepID=A0A1J1HCV2_PLARL|nr:conserved Plasmodium protein, unknown function [Plasmodium relictum]CRH03808.1 conserved Plasmodium protein, unknown function [Plasmodium relictum]